MEWKCARWAKGRTDAVQATDKVLLCDPVLIREGHYAFNDVAVVLVPLASHTADTGACASKYNRRLFSFGFETQIPLIPSSKPGIDHRIDDDKLLNVLSAKIRLGKCDPNGTTTEGL